MKYVKEALVTYIIFFAFFGLFMFGIPLAFVFIFWNWDAITISNVMTILRVNTVIAAIVTVIYYIDLWVKVK